MQVIKHLFCGVLLSVLCSCGFHLRGKQHAIPPIDLSPIPQQNCLFPALQQQLLFLKIQKEHGQDHPRLTIHQQQLLVSTVSYNSFNEVYQQKLHYEVHFSLITKAGIVLLPQTRVHSHREQQLSNSTPFSDQEERSIIEASLCQDVAKQILWQVSQYYAHHPQTVTP